MGREGCRESLATDTCVAPGLHSEILLLLKGFSKSYGRADKCVHMPWRIDQYSRHKVSETSTSSKASMNPCHQWGYARCYLSSQTAVPRYQVYEEVLFLHVTVPVMALQEKNSHGFTLPCSPLMQGNSELAGSWVHIAPGVKLVCPSPSAQCCSLDTVLYKTGNYHDINS